MSGCMSLARSLVETGDGKGDARSFVKSRYRGRTGTTGDPLPYKAGVISVFQMNEEIGGRQFPRSSAGHPVEQNEYKENNKKHRAIWEELAQKGVATMAEFNAAADENVGLLLADRIDIAFCSDGGKILGVVDAPVGVIDASPIAPNAQTLDALMTMVTGCFVAYLNRGARFEVTASGFGMCIHLPAEEWGLRDARAWLNSVKMGGHYFQVLIDFGSSWRVQ